jgi:hypothetical protein
MQSRSIRRSGQPIRASALSNAGLRPGLDLRRELWVGSHVNRINRPNTWLPTDYQREVKISLAKSEVSAHGTLRTCS